MLTRNPELMKTYRHWGLYVNSEYRKFFPTDDFFQMSWPPCTPDRSYDDTYYRGTWYIYIYIYISSNSSTRSEISVSVTTEMKGGTPLRLNEPGSNSDKYHTPQQRHRTEQSGDTNEDNVAAPMTERTRPFNILSILPLTTNPTAEVD